MPDFRTEAEQRCMDAVLGVIKALQPVGKINLDGEPPRFTTERWEAEFRALLADLGAKPTAHNVVRLEGFAQLIFKAHELFYKVWEGELNV